MAVGRNAVYHVARIERDVIWITDECDAYPMAFSVTNDAERVTAEVFATHGDKRIFYRDTSLNWDELLHRGGVFKGFSAGTGGREPPC